MSQFYTTLSDDRTATDELRDASLRSDLARWTSCLTAVAVRAFEALGMPTSAKGHRCTVLPLKQHEYLGQDVMAFPPNCSGWQFPAAVCELENAGSDDRVAYSLWKVLCIRCQLRLVFCYRAEPRAAVPLVTWLGTSVVKAIPVAQRANLEGETVVVVGSRKARVTDLVEPHELVQRIRASIREHQTVKRNGETRFSEGLHRRGLPEHTSTGWNHDVLAAMRVDRVGDQTVDGCCRRAVQTIREYGVYERAL